MSKKIRRNLGDDLKPSASSAKKTNSNGSGSLPAKTKDKKTRYIDGAEGFIQWCEDKVRLPVYHANSPVAQWTYIRDLPKEYHFMWNEEKKVFRKALKMVNGRFVYRLIVFCWPRGEGKSYMTCLIQLWKFFCFPRQQIKLGANSRDQIKFVHYDVMKDIVLNSPELLKVIGTRNILQKEMQLKDKKGNVASVIGAMSTATGIVSNITGYTFSEMFDMKNNKFFVQLDGSTRNMPNALGVIDSTVSTKQHQLYKLYLAYIKKEDPTLFFHYRNSQTADPKDYWNPNMTQIQLNSYKAKFPLGDFERYFQNLWSAGSSRDFTTEIVRSMYYLGVDGRLNNQVELIDCLGKIIRYEESIKEIEEYAGEGEANWQGLNDQMNRLWPIDNLYSITDNYGNPQMATIEDLRAIGDMFDTNWAIMAGVDRADPMKKSKAPAKTIVTIMAKGLANSRSQPITVGEGQKKPYIYFILHMANIEDHDLESIKEVIIEAHIEYNGVDTLCAERWGMWDITKWAEEEDIKVEIIYPTYEKQKSIFTEYFTVWKEGRFKSPAVGIQGQKDDFLFQEEAEAFEHDVGKKWFGSPEKEEKYGIQDDSMYSAGCCMFGGRNLTDDDFVARHGSHFFGLFVPDKSMQAHK